MTERQTPPAGDPEEAEGRLRWREEFPHRHDADALVTRREFLRLAVFTSGALFSGTVLLALLSEMDGGRRGKPKAIAQVDEVPPGRALYFHYPGPDDQAVLLNLPGRGLVGYSQKCTHLACSVYYQEEQERLFCPCHDGAFSAETGEPVAGPPQRALPRIRLEVRGNTIYAVEEIA